MTEEARIFPASVYSDADLIPVLEKATPEELDALVKLFRKKFRVELDESNNSIAAIVHAFQQMGRNYFVLLASGKGKPYATIVYKVAKRCWAGPDKNDSVAEMELKVINRILRKAEKKLSAEQRQELFEELEKASNQKLKGKSLQVVMKQVGTHTVRVIIAQIVAREVLKQTGVQVFARIAISASATRIFALLGGPIGWAVSILWFIWDLAGPAYTVTIPGVVLVGAMRIRQQGEESVEEMKETKNGNG